MTIIRDGKTYELTPAELGMAYREVQRLNDIDDVMEFADMCDDMRKGQPYIDDIRSDPDFAYEVAKKYRQYCNDTNDQSWFDDMSEAVIEVGHLLRKGD